MMNTRKLLFLFLSVLMLTLFSGCGKKETQSEKLARAANAAANNDWESAEKIADQVLRKAPDNPAAGIIKALIHEKKGELPEAVDLARRIAVQNSDNFTAQYTFGRLSFKAFPNHPDNFAILENALRLKPDDTDTLVLLCNAGTRTGKAQVIKYLLRLQANGKYASSATLCYQFAMYYASRNNRSSALSFCKMAIAKSKGNPALIYNLAAFVDNTKFSPADAVKYYKLFLTCPNRNPRWDAIARNRINELSR